MIAPDKIQLNTVERPPSEDFALAVNKCQMERFASMMGKNASVITQFINHSFSPQYSAKKDDVINLIRRRPCSLEDVVNGIGITHNEALKYLDLLRSKNVISEKRTNKTVKYVYNNTKY
jgi:wyosine [tRNA(Phe)-imidazoG37] synthetase (radical SAM superfamily)